MAKQKKRTPRKAGSTKSTGATRRVLFAPWRIEFILGPKGPGCFLCEAARLTEGDAGAWKRSLLLYRDANALVLMNRFPYIGGHLLVAPVRHTAGLAGLSEIESRSVWELARKSQAALERVMQPQGFNLGMNLGKAAGAGVEDHLHLHVLPRWVGDTNFLPIVDGTHSIPVALERLWEDLRPAFAGTGRP